jgi:hypothetical protein
MRIPDFLRNLAGIRLHRQLAPPSERPLVGSNIAMQNLRMRLKYPINNELWSWLVSKGWRTIDMRKERRHYTMVSDNILVRLLSANDIKREAIHKHLVDASEKRAARARRG